MDRARRTSGAAASPLPGGRQAGERERRLEARERRADEREREADEREREADEREREADERDEYTTRLRQHAVELRARVASVRERAAEAVEQARTALAANEDRMRRAEAALNRAHASAARDQASAARSANLGEQRPPRERRDFIHLADGVAAMREKTAAAAAHLAETEAQAARIYDELAATKPRNLEYARLAKDARVAMRRARRTEQKYSS